MEVFDLLDLNVYIKRVLALNFEDQLWVRAELSQVNLSRGHCYLSLVQKDDSEVLAKSDAVIWSSSYRKLLGKYGDILHELLQEGNEVSLQSKVDFHPKFGLKLIIEDIDPAYTMGKVAMERQQTLEKLKTEDLLDKNRQLFLPEVLQNIAVISSETAAGYADFVETLTQNQFGYVFNIHLFPAAVQGVKLVEEVRTSIDKIDERCGDFDAAVIIRGGGGKLDLVGFDAYAVCERAARSQLPILTGIGHEIDRSLLDLVAHTSLRTPTAAAEFIIQNNADFENNLLEKLMSLKTNVTEKIQRSDEMITDIWNAFQSRCKVRLNTEELTLERIERASEHFARGIVASRLERMEYAWKFVGSLHPQRILDRGFSITRFNGQSLTHASELVEGDEIENQLASGRLISQIVRKEEQ